MEKKLTDKQTKIVTILKESDKPMTLAEIGAVLGEPVKSLLDSLKWYAYSP